MRVTINLFELIFEFLRFLAAFGLGVAVGTNVNLWWAGGVYLAVSFLISFAEGFFGGME